MSQAVFSWTWLALFVAISVVRKIHERRAGKRSSLKGTPIAEGALMALWGLAAGILPLVYLFTSWLDFADLPFEMPPALGFLGVGLFLIAIWLLHRSHDDLGKTWSPSVEPEAGERLVTDGVYRRIRHPMYAAHVWWGVAQALLLPNLLAGPLALVLMFVLIAMRVPREERALLETFGDDYRGYMEQTGRILPKLG
ncbi:MAG: isoprenylcysteine carboxylmethyltransferase family protein [Deltaproteobacteria bacterium]|nr:isoprenylcysteine carboxylmethyltransferase family protein [Deltaproteobacteria bacterium]